MMNDFLTEDTQSILLLCGVFGKDRSEKPLSPTEYSKLANWLFRAKLSPKDLLRKENIAEAATGSKIDRQRLESLLDRGVKLGFAVEEWQRNGIWIVSRSDKDYPIRFEKHLEDEAPPLLFGVGDRPLLRGGGVGIVGSRDITQGGENFTRQVAELCAWNQMPVVSGGARGVDQVAMETALGAGGVTIGILAENLLKKSVTRSARHAINDGRLLLLSPYHPNARFTVGTAMGRNKLIYAMADFGLVVSLEYGKGGTWIGAREELKRKAPRPVFVWVGNKSPRANINLLDLGALPWPDYIGHYDFKQLLTDLKPQFYGERSDENLPLFVSRKGREAMRVEEQQTLGEFSDATKSIYQAVLPVILNELGTPITAEDLAPKLEVDVPQLKKWLKKAVAEKRIIRLPNKLSTKPRWCYQRA